MLEDSSTFLSIDLNAVLYNYNFFKSQVKPNTAILAVIKAFAYGHDAVSIAKKLEKENIAYFAVAYIQEGIQLREAGIKTPILVLHPQRSDLQLCVSYNLEPNIYSFKILDAFQKILKENTLENYPIHLKFNTGLNRLGFVKEDIAVLMLKLKGDNTTKIASVFSHLGASEDNNEKDFTRNQIQSYKEIVAHIQGYIDYPFIKHLTNTSGTLNYPEAHFDMVRIGIGLYGYANDPKWTSKLKNVAKLQSVISQKHPIKKGDSVGYNRAYIATKDTVSATIPIGYADGIPRTWGKAKGFVTINGEKALVIGNVCMDMIMVDVTNIPCNEGDVVTLFDTQETLEEIATNIGTISYEILTAISQRIKRTVT